MKIHIFIKPEPYTLTKRPVWAPSDVMCVALKHNHLRHWETRAHLKTLQYLPYRLPVQPQTCPQTCCLAGDCLGPTWAAVQQCYKWHTSPQPWPSNNRGETRHQQGSIRSSQSVRLLPRPPRPSYHALCAPPPLCRSPRLDKGQDSPPNRPWGRDQPRSFSSPCGSCTCAY